jgi:hypothetical protein
VNVLRPDGSIVATCSPEERRDAIWQAWLDLYKREPHRLPTMLAVMLSKLPEDYAFEHEAKPSVPVIASENPFASIVTSIATHSRDYGNDPTDAWVYGIVCGWDDGPDDDSRAMIELAEKHGWTEDDVARLRRLHAKWIEATTDTTLLRPLVE